MAAVDVEPMDAAVASVVASSPHAPDIKPTIEPLAKSANALTPPTSEEMNNDVMKRENEDSELSDLDLDDDDEEDIEPDHYWDDGKIPVFKPTMDQFRSFKKFVDKIDKYGMKSGIVKVIPPKEWRDSLHNLDEYVKRIKIKNPITQEFNGTQGIYTQQNVEKQRSYNLPEWKSLTEETQYQPPAKRGERRRNQEKVVRGATGAARNRTSSGVVEKIDESPKPKRKPGRPPRKRPAVDTATSGDEVESRRSSRAPTAPTPETLASKPAKSSKGPRGRQPRGGGAGQAKSVTSRRLNNTAEAADYIDEEAFKDFAYNIEELDEYTPERCAELEAHYWKSLGFNQPMYAADMPGSLFDDTTTSWNVAKLENLLDVLGTKVPGVNTAYLYMGMWKATFAWHLEDVDLYSINYIHFGAPKQWYSISQEDARKFEKAMKTVWPVDAKNCDQFLRHKTYLISPDVLQRQYGVKVNKLVHYEGEFVITFPYGYHSGYNIGYNCAESVNFATESWLEFGKIARKCNCESDNVWVDVFEIERKLRGEPTPEYIEETDDDSEVDDEDGHLPSPPASVKGKSGAKKRKRGQKQVELKKKKKIRIKIRKSTREPCVMCPNDCPWEPLLPTDNGKKAHRSCALYTPETWVAKDGGKESVCGVTTIDRARLDLKCNFCRSKRGACFQCSSKKCTRAFHATCALAAGVQVDGGMVPTFGEDGTEYYEEGYDFRCKYHRPRMPKVVNVESLENSKRLQNFARDLKPNDVIQAQLVGGEVFAGLVIENRPNEMGVLVDVLPDGERIEVEWKWLTLLDPNDSLRPKPTANAIPMPEGMNKKAVSISNRQDGIPTQDEPFHESSDFKWQEFFNIDMPPPGYMRATIQPPSRLNIDFAANDPPYYYLPTKSTESKSSFTDTPNGTEVAPKANFLDRVQPPKSNSRHSGSRLANASGSQLNQALHQNQAPSAYGGTWTYSQKPYMYKPKEQSKPNTMWAVDHQALANQRVFLADSGASQQHSTQPYTSTNYSHHPASGETSRPGTPLRSFPTDLYYSTKTLPAAYPGQHSAFRDAARRESHGTATLPRSTNKSEVRLASGDQQPEESNFPPSQAHASIASAPYVSAATADGYIAAVGGASTDRSTYAAPLIASAQHSILPTPKHDYDTYANPAYLDNLRKYPYLYQSFQQRPKVYESPYAISDTVKGRAGLSELPNHEHGARPRSVHTPKASISSQSDSAHRVNGQWTPPSQIWGRVPNSTVDPRASYTAQMSLPPINSTAHDFQRHVHPMSSTSNQDSAYARLIRDHNHRAPSYQPNRFNQEQVSDGQIWYSPKAPTPSPLSDSHHHSGAAAKNVQYASPNGSAHWSTPSGPESVRSSLGGGYGYGSMMPHGGGAGDRGAGAERETWRYGQP